MHPIPQVMHSGSSSHHEEHKEIAGGSTCVCLHAYKPHRMAVNLIQRDKRYIASI